MLSGVAGMVDVIGFLTLGLFTAHVTGNLVVIAALLVRGGPPNIAQVLAIPVFMAAVAAVWLIAKASNRRGPALAKLLLAVHFLLLICVLTFSLVYDPAVDPHGLMATIAAMMAVSAMACQFALLRLAVPGAPLEIRWALPEGQNWAITAAALTSQLWLIKRDAHGSWAAKDVAAIGDPAKIPLPVDISITADAKGLWVNTFMDGTTHYFDLTDPEHPRQTYAKHTGAQVNMVSQSWDGRRVYITSSLLSKWDKTGKDNEQFLRAFRWDGHELTPAFEVDFTQERLGRPHHMKFTANPQRMASLTGASLR